MNMKKYIYLCFALLLAGQSFAQKRPKLVVGIVVDQMRYDYLYRFQNKYSNGGFKRLLNTGYSFEQCHINYMPTFTAPGHACIYTGTTPSINGIVANDWYERSINDSMYCVADSNVTTIGSANKKAGKMSPNNLYTTTMTDELRMATNNQGKVIAVCIKDRGSILPGGHHPSGAYWFDSDNGAFITSTYYTWSLPHWVTDFNNIHLPETLINKTWDTYFPIKTYTESTADDVVYEAPLSKKEEKPVFPHKLGLIRKDGYGTLLTTPFGNTLLKEFALQALKHEDLGNDSITDFLAISFSSTDYVGHHFGTFSIELEDTYIRLDRDIEEILNKLDAQVGKGNYLVFLTADHGAAHNVQYLKDRNMPAGLFNDSALKDTLKTYLGYMNNEYEKWDFFYDNQQIYLTINGNTLSKNAPLPPAMYPFMDRLLTIEGVDKVYTGSMMSEPYTSNAPGSLIQKGYRFERCGDIIINLKPGWMEMPRKTGTTHGSPYDYDTHIPFLLMGWGIKQGQSTENVNMIDIAPTISSLIKIPNPSGCVGKAVYR